MSEGREEKGKGDEIGRGQPSSTERKKRIKSKKKRRISSKTKRREEKRREEKRREKKLMMLVPFLRNKIKIRCERRSKRGRGLIGYNRNIAC